MNSIKECFKIILNGDSENCRLASLAVKKVLYRTDNDIKKYEEIREQVNLAPENYERITEEWRQKNFVRAISVIYFLRDVNKSPDFLFPWFFQLLKNKNGIVRYSAVKMISHELWPLTVHIRFPEKKSTILGVVPPHTADKILFSLFVSLHQFLQHLWKPEYKKYRYFKDLPTNSYKSVSMVLIELEELCGKEYIKYLEDEYKKLLSNPPNIIGTA
jgi:hypothetical protein